MVQHCAVSPPILTVNYPDGTKGEYKLREPEAIIGIGQVVILKSGSPRMTVGRLFGIAEGPRTAECHWFNGCIAEKGTFPVESLKAV